MRIVFMGTGEIAIPTFRWLLESREEHQVVGAFTQPDKKVGRKQLVTPPEIKLIAEAHGIEVFQPASLRKEPEALDQLARLRPDLIVVMAYGQILPAALLEIPRLACVNLHASLLPRHRGASPIQAAIREGDRETGLTLMHIEPRLDAGDMILEKRIPIRESDTGGTLHDRLAELGPTLLAEGIALFRAGGVEARPQDESEVTYAPKLERDDGRIDWSRDAEEIERLIRAYDPWPGAHTTLPHEGDARKLKIFPPARVAGDVDASPGAVVDSSDRLVVACGNGGLELAGQLQLEGRKRLAAGDFLRGTSLDEGIVLGNSDDSA